jgi:hypothetical protein
MRKYRSIFTILACLAFAGLANGAAIAGTSRISVSAVTIGPGSQSVTIQQNSAINIARVVEVGDVNNVSILQDGIRNLTMVIQVGNVNNAGVVQIGQTNTAFIRQVGRVANNSFLGQAGILNTGYVNQSSNLKWFWLGGR